jgi:hypothetical protein
MTPLWVVFAETQRKRRAKPGGVAARKPVRWISGKIFLEGFLRDVRERRKGSFIFFSGIKIFRTEAF